MKYFFFQISSLTLISLFTLNSFAQIQAGAILRDEYALALTPTIKSMGMGGAYVGVDGTRSMNPASLSSINGYEGSLWYGFYDHDAGPEAHRGRLDGVLPVPYVGGGARLMLDGLISDGEGNTLLDSPGGGTFGIEFDAITLGLQYGRNITDWFAVGVGAYPYERAQVDLIMPDGTEINGEAFSQIGSIQLGTILRPHEMLTIGGQFMYVKDDLEAGLPNGSIIGDYYDIHYFAIGASFRPFDGTLIALDYWNGEAEGAIAPGVAFDEDVDRWNVGVEQALCDFFDLRVGYNNGGITAGFSVHVNDNIDLDYAYVNEYLGDKEVIFDETDFHGLSLTMRF